MPDLRDPESLRGFLDAGEFATPDRARALEAFRRLQLGGGGGMEALFADPLGARPEIEEALFSRAEEDINRQADDLTQRERETFFGRNVGESTMTQNAMNDITRERMDAIARARREAILGAGAEARSDLGARLSALSNAFTMGTQGIQGEANIGFNNLSRDAAARTSAATLAAQSQQADAERGQRESQFGRQIGQQESQFGRGLAQRGEQFGGELAARERLQERGFQNAEKIASENRLAAGIGGGLSGLANLFGPAANNFLANTFDAFKPQPVRIQVT